MSETFEKMYWLLKHAKHVLDAGNTLRPGGAFHLEINQVTYGVNHGELLTEMDKVFEKEAPQTDLFGIAPPPAHVLSRAGDPHTSEEAVKKINVTKQMEIVLLAIRKHNGTSSRVLAEVCHLDRYMVGRRMPDLEKCGMVKRKLVNMENSKPSYKTDQGGVRWFVTERGFNYEVRKTS